MTDKGIVAVPLYLYAEKTKNTNSKKDVIEINEAMQLCFDKLENDRDFPVYIKLQTKAIQYGSTKLLSKKNAEVVRTKFADVGYDAKLDLDNNLILSHPINNKKQNLDESPPSYS